MITVRCPSCGKIIGFDESDGGALVACPHCREPFFVPSVARPVVPVEAAPAPAPSVPEPPRAASLPQAPDLPDDIAVAADPDLDFLPPPIDDVVPVEEPPPEEPPFVLSAEPPAPEPPTESMAFEVVPEEPNLMPRLELDTAPPPPPEPPPPEPAGIPAEVKPTDLAPSREAAEVLAEAVPKPVDQLDEVDEDEEDRERRRRPKSKKREKGSDRPRSDDSMSPRRTLGMVGVMIGTAILTGTLLHHVTGGESAWHWGVCLGDVFALALAGVGLFYMIRG
jgi:hypothetical protein